MSTQGAGVASLVGVLAAGAAVVVIGAGVLCVNGVMWCGEKLEEHYQQALREWAELRQRAYDEQRRKVEGQLSHYARMMSVGVSTLPSHTTVNQHVGERPNNAELARAAQAFQAALASTPPPGAIERQELVAALQREIASGRGTLPAQAVRAAEQALNGNAATVQQALTNLRAAWVAVQDERLQREHQANQMRWQIVDAANQLQAIRAMSIQNGIASSPQQEAALAQMLSEAEQRLNAGDLPGAQVLAQQSQDQITGLLRAVASAVATGWADVQGALAALQGKLDALHRILVDAKELKLADAKSLEALEADIATEQREVTSLAGQNRVSNPRELAILRAKVEVTERNVFAATKQGQQRQLATAVAETLSELGYHGPTGQTPTAQTHGGMAHIDAVPASERTARTGRRVTFDVSLEGEVVYDFQGYVGTTCEDDAREIFAALRKRGIILHDRYSGEEIQEAAQNKRQARLYERLKSVLQNMHFTNIQETFASGIIELEAFNGDVGYRVTLAPDEEERPEVLRNHQNVSADMRDPIVAAIQADDASQPPSPPAPHPSRTTMPQQQILEH